MSADLACTPRSLVYLMWSREGRPALVSSLGEESFLVRANLPLLSPGAIRLLLSHVMQPEGT